MYLTTTLRRMAFVFLLGGLGACSDGSTGGPPAGEWLKGDLHLHSAHSNDALDNPQAEVIAKAEALGMDYFVFTDHDNHVQGDITTWSDPAYRSDRMVLLYGVEWTTARGHAGVFATAPWDHSRLYAIRDGDGAATVAEAHALGLHFSVNHPAAGDPWEHPFEVDFDSLEVWNAVWVAPANNAGAIALWDEILASGRRLPARGGSDVHHQQGIESRILNVGNPTTFLYARERTAEAVLAASATTWRGTARRSSSGSRSSASAPEAPTRSRSSRTALGSRPGRSTLRSSRSPTPLSPGSAPTTGSKSAARCRTRPRSSRRSTATSSR
jgi:hypothetical protein